MWATFPEIGRGREEASVNILIGKMWPPAPYLARPSSLLLTNQGYFEGSLRMGSFKLFRFWHLFYIGCVQFIASKLT